MMCWMGGNGLGASSFSSRYAELSTAVLVYAWSCSPVKGAMNEAVPVWMRPTYSTAALPVWLASGRREGFGPLGFGWEPPPRPFSTTRTPPGSTRAAVGYQPVGMKPATWLRSPGETSTTATTLPSEQTTYRCVSSGLRASPLGVMPAGWRGVIAVLMVSSRRRSLPSETPRVYTLLVLDAAMNRRAA